MGKVKSATNVNNIDLNCWNDPLTPFSSSSLAHLLAAHLANFANHLANQKTLIFGWLPGTTLAYWSYLQVLHHCYRMIRKSFQESIITL